MVEIENSEYSQADNPWTRRTPESYCEDILISFAVPVSTTSGSFVPSLVSLFSHLRLPNHSDSIGYPRRPLLPSSVRCTFHRRTSNSTVFTSPFLPHLIPQHFTTSERCILPIHFSIRPSHFRTPGTLQTVTYPTRMCFLNGTVWHCSLCNRRVSDRPEDLVGRIFDLCGDGNCDQLELRWAVQTHVCSTCRIGRQPNGNGHPVAREDRLVNGMVPSWNTQESGNTGIGGNTSNTQIADGGVVPGPSGSDIQGSGGLRRSATQTQLAGAPRASQPTAPLAIHGHNPSTSTQGGSSHGHQDSLASNATEGILYIPDGDEAGDVPITPYMREQMERDARRREQEERERRR